MKVIDYKIILEEGMNKNKKRKDNPVPVDALKISDLYGLTHEEILKIVNRMGRIKNKSDIRVMYAHGYGFSWAELVVIAEFYGLIRTSGKKRRIQYAIPVEDWE